MRFIEFFLFGSSFSNWEKIGTFDREIDYYKYYSNYIDPFFITYDIEDYKRFGTTNLFSVNLGDKSFLFKRLYTFYKLFIYFRLNKRFIEDVRYFRSKQIYGSFYALVFARLHSKKVVLRVGYSYTISKSFENILFKRFENILFFLERWYVSKFDLVIYPSEYLRDKYSLSKRSCVLPNPINSNIFNFDFGETKKYDFIYVGRLIKVKGVDRLLKFINHFESGLIVGSGLMKEKLSSKFSFSNNIPNSELVKFYKQSKYILNFSFTEGSPKALLEGIFCGCIPILSDIPVHRELISVLGYGLVINDFSVDFSLDTSELVINVEKLVAFRENHSMSFVVKKECDFILENL